MTTESVDVLASGTRCQCSGRGCVHAGRCKRRHDIGPDILTEDVRGDLICGGCRRIREPGHADSIDRAIAAARRRLLIAKGQLSLF